MICPWNNNRYMFTILLLRTNCLLLCVVFWIKRMAKISRIKVQIASKLESCSDSKQRCRYKFTCRHSCPKTTTEYWLDISLVIYSIVIECPRKICISCGTFCIVGTIFSSFLYVLSLAEKIQSFSFDLLALLFC